MPSRVVNSLGVEKTTPGIARGTIVSFSGAAIPDGWALCDGTNGTPDLTDRFVVGDTAVGIGSAAGTASLSAALTHSGLAVANHDAHSVGQAAAHDAHSVGQAAAHDAHAVTQAADHPQHAVNAAHTHDGHTGANKTAGARTVITVHTHNASAQHLHDVHPAHTGGALDSHSAHASGALDSHSAHAGAALDAHSVHSVTQPSTHGVLKHYLLVRIMKL